MDAGRYRYRLTARRLLILLPTVRGQTDNNKMTNDCVRWLLACLHAREFEIKIDRLMMVRRVEETCT